MCCAWRVKRSADSLPDDVDALRALALNAIAERDAAIAERDRLIELNDRLRHLLRKAQGFEAKSERLAEASPRSAQSGAGRPRAGDRQNRGDRGENANRRCGAETADQPRRAADPFAAHSRDGCAGRRELPVLQEADARDRRRDFRAARRDPGPIPGDRHAPAEARLPGVREDRRSAGAGASDQIRLADRSHGRFRAGGQIRLAPAALSPGEDAVLPGHRPRSFDTGLLGWLCGGGIDAAVRAAQGQSLGLRQTRRRRDAGAGARSGTRADQDRLLLGDGARRPALGRNRSAGRRLHLRTGSRRRASREAACRLSRHRAVRRLCSLQEIAGGQDHSRLLLEPPETRILQDR